MLGLYVTVPIACFRKGLAREFLETEVLPPPSTCYGFLLSLVGETNRKRHENVRVTAGVIGQPEKSIVLRTVWRLKSKPLGSAGNTRPDYQQLLSSVSLVIWLDSSEESNAMPTLEHRVTLALDPLQRHQIERFGGLSLGESTHLVDDVKLIEREKSIQSSNAKCFVIRSNGNLTLPVWVDHVGSAGTRYTTGVLVEGLCIANPPLEHLPIIKA